MPEQKRYVAITVNGVAYAKRYHLYLDCSATRFDGPDGVENLTERETKLLGLKVCSVCERRESGGPAMNALEGFFGEDGHNIVDEPKQSAWNLLEYLKERGMYIAQRKPKDEVTRQGVTVPVPAKKGAADAD